MYFYKLKPETSGLPILTGTGAQNYNWDVKDIYKSVDMGVSIQIEYDCKLTNKLQLNLFSRFNYGSINVIKIDGTYKWRNYNVNFGTGIKI